MPCLDKIIYELLRHTMLEELKLAIKENNPDRLKYIDIRNNVNLRFEGGTTPLNYALLLKREDIAKYLIEHGVDFKQSDRFELDDERKRCPIHYAAESGMVVILDLLVRQKNVDINTEDFNGNTALNYGVKSGNIDTVKYLLELGSDINRRNKYGNSVLWDTTKLENSSTEILSLLLQNGADVNIQNDVGSTVLFPIVHKNKLDLMQLVLNHGLNVNLRDIEGNTILHFAASIGNLQATAIILSQTKCDINAQNEYGNTALHNSAIYNHTNVILQLANYGISIATLNRCKQSALYLAMLHEHLDSAELLYNLGAQLTDKELAFYEQFEARKSESRQDFFDTVLELFSSPKSLCLLAINCIRNRLTKPVCDCVIKLPIPKQIRNDIALTAFIQNPIEE